MDDQQRRCRFVQGEIVRLPLSSGEWIDVKAELNAGEARRVFSSLVKTMRPGEPAELDADRVGVTRITAYLVGWSLLNRDGRPEPLDESAIDNLDLDTYQEIVAAVDAHDLANENKRIARKKNPVGETLSRAISVLPSDAAGASTGFAN